MNNNVVQQIVSNFKRSDEFKRLGNDWFLPRDAMQKRGLYAVMRCLHVCLSVRLSVTFVDHVKTSKHVFEIFSTTRIATPFQFFRTKRGGDIPTGMPLTEASNAGYVGKKRDSRRISGFAAYRSTVLSTVRVANCEKQSRGEQRQASSTHRGVHRPLFAQADYEVFVTSSTLYAGDEGRSKFKPPLVITPVFCCRRTS